MTPKQKRPPSKKQQLQQLKRQKQEGEKVMRLAHKILTKSIWPANLNLEETVDVVITLVEALVISNTEDSDPDDRAGMIEWIEDRFMGAMCALNPNADDPEHPPHAWFVAPQGLITEPAAFLWPGTGGGDVQVLIGTDLAKLRADIEAKREETGMIVTEGVEGLAMVDPEWDGESEFTCDNPECGATHDVHLMFAENLFREAKQRGATN